MAAMESQHEMMMESQQQYAAEGVEQDEEEAVGFHPIVMLEGNGINAGDIKKLQGKGFNTCESVGGDEKHARSFMTARF